MIELAHLDDLPDAFFAVEDGVVLWCSRSAARLLGCERDELVGLALDALLDAGEPERFRAIEEQRRAGWVIPHALRMRFRVPGGGNVSTDIRLGHAQVDGANLLLISARDASEVERAEALMRRLTRLAVDADAATDAEALLDACAPVFLELGWGVGFTEVVEGGSVMRKVVAAEGFPVGAYGQALVGLKLPFERTPMVTEVVSTEAPLLLDNLPTLQPGKMSEATAMSDSMVEAKIGRSAWCPVRSGGQLSHLIVVVGADISEHDFIALQLFATQLGAATDAARAHLQAMRRERLTALGEMSAVMAHEVRNPLSIIFNAVAGLRRQMTDDASPQLLDIIDEEGRRLRRLVEDLLDFARPRLSSREEIELGHFVDRVVLAVGGEEVRAHITTEVEDRGVRVVTDEQALQRAVVNLLLNAVAHVPPGGRIELSVRVEDATLVIRVWNEGDKLDPELRHRVFDPFFTTRATGTGLGLAVVRGVADDLGGVARVEDSDEGFAISLRVPAK